MSSLAMVQAAGVARNPSADTEVLLRLVHWGEQSLCFSVIYRTDVPDRVYDALVAHPDPLVRGVLAYCWDAPATQRARLASDPDNEVRRKVALGPQPFRRAVEPLPDATYAQLAGDPAVNVRAVLAEVRLIPESVRRRLLADDHPAVRRAALEYWPTPLNFRMFAPIPRPPDDVVSMLLADPDPNVARAARSVHAPTALAELMAGLAEDFDPTGLSDHWHLYELAVLARHVLLTPDMAVALADDRRSQIRQAVAQNASLAPDLVARLATDPEPSVRLAVSMRPELTEAQRAEIDYEVHPGDRLNPPDWVFRNLDDLTLMRKCARSAHIGLRRCAAYSPYLTPDLVAALAGDPDFAVRLLLCENHPDAPAELLLRTFLEAKVVTRWDLLDKPNFPRSGLAGGADSDDPDRRYLALMDLDATPEQVERLSHDEVEYVRSAAASDRRLRFARVWELLADPDSAEAAASNPLVPTHLMHEILDAAGAPSLRSL